MMITLRGGVLKDSSKIIKINSYCSQILHLVIYCYNFPKSFKSCQHYFDEVFFSGGVY
jgi:hypothetical protein